MIGRLTGTLAEKHPPLLLLDVNGIGYEVEASMNTFYQLPEIGEKLVLFTHFIVREDAQLLYGFIEQEERSLFRLLIKANGVGPKLAITILSGISTPEFIRSVQENDTARLIKLPGVGKKTAERLIVEMKDKISTAGINITASDNLSLSSSQQSNNIFTTENNRSEAESALIALGYKPAQASRAIEQAINALGNDNSSEDLIRHSLRGLAGG